ncbi:hypothetical protein FACS189485_22780 [Spirochaetia bacterium]|nr:hypothetical protein FACS189485_22780 [Spirochaetia bacterium]
MGKDSFNENDFTKEKVTINIIWANIFGLVVLIIVAILFGIPFYLLWHEKYVNVEIYNPVMNLFDRIKIIGLYLLIFILLTIMHELIHGISFAMFSQNKFRSIKIGILPAQKLFTPYCHCMEKLKIKHYRIAAVMPLIILGIIPTIISICIGNITLLFWGIILIVVAGGDILIIYKTLKEKEDVWVFDHPSEAGYFIYRPINK